MGEFYLIWIHMEVHTNLNLQGTADCNLNLFRIVTGTTKSFIS